jgi:hypothetical protein
MNRGVDQENPQDGQEEPTDRLYFPSDAFHSFLPGYSEQLGLSFVYDKRQASVAINTGVAKCENEVFLF